MRDADTRRPEVKNLTYMSSFLSSIFTSAFNNTMARQNARESMAWQERMMDKQNFYNSPLGQLLMKKSAGVNPYGETGFVPSAGVSGVQADTIPMNDPLQYAKTFAEIENLNASTNKTETETEKLLKEMSVLDLGLARGLISNEEYEKRVKMMFEAWEKNNPYEVEMENTLAGTEFLKEQTETENAKQVNLEALTQTENELRELRKSLLSMQTEEIEQHMVESRQRVRELQQDIEAQGYENNIAKMQTAISRFFRSDISSLPAELQYKAAEYMRDCLDGEYTYQSTIDAFTRLVNEYIYKDTHITYSESHTSGSLSVSASALGKSFSFSKDGGAKSRTY